MSKTPRTDAEFKFEAFFDGFGIVETIQVEFARQLEADLADKDKQLAETQAETQELYIQLATELKAEHAQELAEMRAEIERKDTLIERLKCCGNCALKDLTAIPHVLTHPYRDFCAVCKDRSKWHQTIESAALSAAERGE